MNINQPISSRVLRMQICILIWFLTSWDSTGCWWTCPAHHPSCQPTSSRWRRRTRGFPLPAEEEVLYMLLRITCFSQCRCNCMNNHSFQGSTFSLLAPFAPFSPFSVSSAFLFSAAAPFSACPFSAIVGSLIRSAIHIKIQENGHWIPQNKRFRTDSEVILRSFRYQNQLAPMLQNLEMIS